MVAFAKKTGDYSVLSQTDMSVIALTCQYELQVNGEKYVRSQPGEKKASQSSGQSGSAKGKGKGKERAKEESTATAQGGDAEAEQEEQDEVENLVDQVGSIDVNDQPAAAGEKPNGTERQATEADEDSEDAGDWITPSNVAKHRSRDLGLVPSGSGSDQAPLAAACMTGDYAVQNVLLSMGLGLIGEAGKRINKVKSFILRCHACFKYVPFATDSRQCPLNRCAVC